MYFCLVVAQKQFCDLGRVFERYRKVCHEENDLVGLHKFIVVLFDD